MTISIVSQLKFSTPAMATKKQQNRSDRMLAQLSVADTRLVGGDA